MFTVPKKRPQNSGTIKQKNKVFIEIYRKVDHFVYCENFVVYMKHQKRRGCRLKVPNPITSRSSTSSAVVVWTGTFKFGIPGVSGKLRYWYNRFQLIQ